MGQASAIVSLWREATAVESELANVGREAAASPLFEVPVPALAPFLSRAKRRAVPAGAAIRRQDELSDELFYLHSGLLRQTLITADGAEKVVGMVKP
ncbi:MAG: cyclic nucleotide-binding domain-containing protein, partial [Chloroflexota bacterium]